MIIDGTVAEILVIVGMIAGPGGAAWVAVKTGLNGAKQDITEIKHNVECVRTNQVDAAIEVTKLDGRVARLEDYHKEP